MVRQCLHKPSTECHRSHSSGLKYWWVTGSSLMSLTLNQQVNNKLSLQTSHLAPLLPLLLQVLYIVYAVLCCFNVEVVLCTLKFLWLLAYVYFAYGIYSKLMTRTTWVILKATIMTQKYIGTCSLKID